MTFCISKPSILLSKFVKHYWTIESCIPKNNEHIQRIVPNGLSELMFYFGDKPESTDKNISIDHNTLIKGQLNGYYDIKITGELSLFSIVFQPYGASMFFNIPLSELLNQNVPLRFILKDVVNELEGRLFDSNSFDEKIRIVEHFLLQRLQKNEMRNHFHRITESVKLINQTRGNININFLASEACYSRKQFERTFLDLIGISPKQFLKVVRFQHAINEKSKDLITNLTTLAYQCGYYDQSHMINDFYKLSGMSPKQYFSDCEPYSDYFQ
jgi:AraC-like DNA-binding protein